MAFERISPKSKIIAAISNRLNQIISPQKKEQKLSPEKRDAYNLLTDLFEDSVIKTHEIIQKLPRENQPLQKDILSIWNKHL